MNPFDNQLTEGQQMLACVAFLTDGEHGADIFKFAGEEVSEKLTRFANRWFKRGRLNHKDVTEHIKRLMNRQTELTFFHDIHPGWLVEHLRDESPRVIGLICRWLPSEKVRYIIQNLPPDIRFKLPKVSDAYMVPTDLATEIRKILESRFRPQVLPMQGEPFSFHHLAWLKEEELGRVIREIGTMEVCSAFSGMSDDKLKPFLNRFPHEQAKVLYKRMKSPKLNWRSFAKAQRHLVSLDISNIDVDGLFWEIGFSLLAHALSPKDLPWCETIVNHLVPKKGYLFKRYVQQAMSVYREEEAVEIKKLVLNTMIRLADVGYIKKYWKDEEYTSSLSEEAA